MYIQQVTLQPQRHRRLRRHNGLTRLLHVDIEDSFARDALECRLGAERRNEPDGRYAVLAAREDYMSVSNDLRTRRARLDASKARWR